MFDGKPLAYKDKVTADMSWSDIPTCKSQGLDMEYLMLRGIFMPPNVTKEQAEYFVDLFKRVRATPEWQEFMQKGAFNTTALTGAEYAAWLGKAAASHKELMEKAGFVAK